MFDHAGLMIAQSLTGTPGHVNSMATCIKHFIAAFPPATLEPGDVLITNDPWMTAGQINDFTLVTPIFRDGRPIAYFASTCHAPDIGGRHPRPRRARCTRRACTSRCSSSSARGEPNEECSRSSATNVRQPDEIESATSTRRSARTTSEPNACCSTARRVRSRRHRAARGRDHLAVRARDARRDRRAARRHLRRTRPGRDGYDEPSCCAARVTVDGRRADASTGRAARRRARYGINLVLNYTHAYACFAMKAAIAPEVPHNDGALPTRARHGAARARSSTASTRRRSPSRHVIGHFLPGIIFGALAPAMPGRLLAGSADALWITVWQGRDRARRPFVQTVFQLGGMGARPTKDGLSATGFPSGVAGMPAEVVESLSPLVSAAGSCVRLGRRGPLPRRSRPGSRDHVLDRRSLVRLGAARPHAAIRRPVCLAGVQGAVRCVPAARRRRPADQARRPLDPPESVELRLPGGGGYGEPRAGIRRPSCATWSRATSRSTRRAIATASCPLRGRGGRARPPASELRARSRRDRPPPPAVTEPSSSGFGEPCGATRILGAREFSRRSSR